MKRLTGLTLVLLMVLGACSDGSDGDDSGPLDPESITRLVDASFEITVSGDIEITHEDSEPLRVVELNQADVSTLRFFSIGLESPVIAESGEALRFAVDLAGDYDGPGTYEITAAGESSIATVDPESLDPNPAASGLSQAFLEFNAEGSPLENPELAAQTQVFDNVVEPCTLQLGDELRAGRLECPELADDEGNVIAMTVTWETTE